VALPAVDLFMCSCKRIPCQIVIKALLVKPHHVEVAAVMLAVTFEAILTTDLK
jgi:hypothetical protein